MKDEGATAVAESPPGQPALPVLRMQPAARCDVCGELSRDWYPLWILGRGRVRRCAVCHEAAVRRGSRLENPKIEIRNPKRRTARREQTGAR